LNKKNIFIHPFIFLFCLGFFHFNSYSQIIKLTDIETKKSISGALVKLYQDDERTVISNETKFKKRIYSTKNGTIFIDNNAPFRLNISHISFSTLDTIISYYKDTIFLSLQKSKTPLDEVVVTAQIGEESVYKSVNSFILISKKKIQENASNNLVDLLNTQALFDIQFDQSLGSALSIQGMDGNNVNILVDGIPILGRKGGQIDLGQVNLSNVDRVEILKGPAAVSYGTNSTGGVINLITNTIQSDNLTFNSYFENIGLSQLNINSRKIVNNQNFQFNIGTYDFLGIGNENERSMNWNPKKQNFGDIYWENNYDRYKIQFKSSIFEEKIIDLGNENFPPFDGTAIDNHYSTIRNTHYLRYNRYSDFYNINSLFSYSSTKFNKEQYYIDLINNSSEQTTSIEYNSQDLFSSFYNRLEYNRFSSDIYKVQIGLDFNYEEVKGPKIKEGNASVFEQSFFFQSNMKITNNLNTQLGIRIPYHSIYSAPIIPSLYLKYDFSPKLTIRTSYARGFRAPSIKELFLEFIDSNHNIVGNQDLDAEKSHSLQASVSYFPIREANNFLSFNGEFYLNDLENQISLAQIQNSNEYTYYNIDESLYYGLNLKLKCELGERNTFDFMWNNYIVKNNILDYKRPKQNLSASYSYYEKEYGFGFNLNWKFKSKSEYERFNELGILETFFQESYNLCNASLSKEFYKINTSIKFGFKNIFDVKSIQSGIQEGFHDQEDVTISWGRTNFLSIIYKPF
tara:strand:+ start:7327 stop:9546 length:2220 start_codon:yes stop_codon:yes gene_type:complete